MPNQNISAAAIFLVVSVLSYSVLAADPILSPGDTDLIRDRQERLLQEQQRKLDELQQLPGDTRLAVPELADESRCFDIKEIRLSGAAHISEAQQSKLLKPFIGQCLGAAGIDTLMKTLGRYYMERGHVTSRAYLPKQDLNSGVLQLAVIEGKLEGFEPSALASPREITMTFPGKTGEILDLRKLEQQAEQLGRLPSRAAQLELVPGQQMGQSWARLKGEREKSWRISANRHNNGERSTGEQQWGAAGMGQPVGFG